MTGISIFMDSITITTSPDPSRWPTAEVIFHTEPATSDRVSSLRNSNLR
jgi:hypothetical protein